MTDSIVNVRLAPDSPGPRVKRIPHSPLFVHTYTASDDGTDENLLILLHGLDVLASAVVFGLPLGDTHLPFAKLGKQLRLPQTATLALQAPQRIPYLYEDAYQWYESFDALGDLLERPNPTSGLERLHQLVDHLVDECKWPPNRIHLFGFGQGGGLGAEIALRWWKTHSTAPQSQLASVVSIAGPLLSYPTLPSLCPTPVLVYYRPGSESTMLSASDVTAFKKGFRSVREVTGGKGEGMPRSKEEWEGIMRFWSENLGMRRGDGLYEIMR